MTAPLHPRQDPTRRCRKPAEWPAVDQAAWALACAPGDPLEPGGGAAGWRSHTRRKNAAGYGRWLTWLHGQGALDPQCPPGARVTRARVVAYVAHLESQTAGSTVLCRLAELRAMLRVLAPAGDWAWIGRLAAAVRARSRPARNKRVRLRPTHEIVGRGLALMGQARAGRRTALQEALQFRDGLILALWAARPVRRGNFAIMRLGRHLVVRQGGLWLQFQAHETKTGAPIAAPLPAALVPSMERYVSIYRPQLAARRGRWSKPVEDFLWVSKDGSPMTEIALYFRIRILTGKAFRQPLSPHLLRDALVTTLADEDPANIGLAAALLGHRSAKTAERHYNQAQMGSAVRQYQAAILARFGRRRRR